MPVEVHPADPAAEPGAGLLAAMVAEIAGLYGGGDSGRDPRFAVDPAQLGPPAGAFLLVWDDGAAVACGGVKRLDDRTAEIKRMYVVPEARSRGHARRLLAGLEVSARELGYARLRLDSGARMTHALALYASAGYAEIPDYNANPRASHWFEKAL